ncbi:MAG TPA: hypothetical protein VIL20_22710 [Sandaracinaceae bacterium]
MHRSLIAGALLLAACSGERGPDEAERALAEDGYTAVRIVERLSDEHVRFEARRGAERCRGELWTRPRRYAIECRPDEPLEAIERDCEAGDLERCVEAAALVRSDPPIDWPRATLLSARACEGGRERECLYVGMAHELGGRGVPRDREAARAMYERACAAGMPPACARRDALAPR